jgi:hypothetical protein
MRVSYAAAIGPLAGVALKYLDSVQTSGTTSEALVRYLYDALYLILGCTKCDNRKQGMMWVIVGASLEELCDEEHGTAIPEN